MHFDCKHQYLGHLLTLTSTKFLRERQPRRGLQRRRHDRRVCLLCIRIYRSIYLPAAVESISAFDSPLLSGLLCSSSRSDG